MARIIFLFLVITAAYPKPEWVQHSLDNKNVLAVLDLSKGSTLFASIKNEGVFKGSRSGDFKPLYSFGCDTFEVPIKNVHDLWSKNERAPLYAATNKGIYIYDEYGGNQQWQRVEGVAAQKFHTISSFKNRYFNNPKYVFAAGERVLYRKKINEKVWEKLTVSLPSHPASIVSVFVRAGMIYDDTVYLGISLGTSSFVMRSANYGESWHQLKLPQEVAEQKIGGIVVDYIRNFDDKVFIGGQKGLYQLENNFRRFKKLETNPVTGLRLCPSVRVLAELFTCTNNFNNLGIQANDFSSDHTQFFFAATSNGIYHKYYTMETQKHPKDINEKTSFLVQKNRLIINSKLYGTVLIYTVEGQLIKSVYPARNSFVSIDLSSLPSGTYIAKCSGHYGKAQSHQFVYIRT